MRRSRAGGIGWCLVGWDIKISRQKKVTASVAVSGWGTKISEQKKVTASVTVSGWGTIVDTKRVLNLNEPI